MYISKLKNIIKPNNELLDTYTKEKWDEIEFILGIKLPTDYKKFINTYGVGSIGEFLVVLNPFTQNMNLNLIEKGKEIREAYIVSKNAFPEDFTHNVFPTEGGLLPCAITDNGDEIYWLTSNIGDEWHIVVYESRSASYYEYNMGLAEFLYKILTKEVECFAFPDDFPGDECEFIV